MSAGRQHEHHRHPRVPQTHRNYQGKATLGEACSASRPKARGPVHLARPGGVSAEFSVGQTAQGRQGESSAPTPPAAAGCTVGASPAGAPHMVSTRDITAPAGERAIGWGGGTAGMAAPLPPSRAGQCGPLPVSFGLLPCEGEAVCEACGHAPQRELLCDITAGGVSSGGLGVRSADGWLPGESGPANQRCAEKPAQASLPCCEESAHVCEVGFLPPLVYFQPQHLWLNS